MANPDVVCHGILNCKPTQEDPRFLYSFEDPPVESARWFLTNTRLEELPNSNIPAREVRKWGLKRGAEVGVNSRGRIITVQNIPVAEWYEWPKHDTTPSAYPHYSFDLDITGRIDPSQYSQREQEQIGYMIDTVRAFLVTTEGRLGYGQRVSLSATYGSGKSFAIDSLALALALESHDRRKRGLPPLHIVYLSLGERPEDSSNLDEYQFTRDIFFPNGRPVIERWQTNMTATDEDSVEMAHLVHARVQRIVEMRPKGDRLVMNDVVLLIDSVTRLGRSFKDVYIPKPDENPSAGGIYPGVTKHLLRYLSMSGNHEGLHEGSLTMISTALLYTDERGDDQYYGTAKGSGNVNVGFWGGAESTQLPHDYMNLADEVGHPAINLKGCLARNMGKIKHPRSETDELNEHEVYLLASRYLKFLKHLAATQGLDVALRRLHTDIKATRGMHMTELYKRGAAEADQLELEALQKQFNTLMRKAASLDAFRVSTWLFGALSGLLNQGKVSPNRMWPYFRRILWSILHHSSFQKTNEASELEVVVNSYGKEEAPIEDKPESDSGLRPPPMAGSKKVRKRVSLESSETPDSEEREVSIAQKSSNNNGKKPSRRQRVSIS